MLLALDTSTERLGLALADAGGLVLEWHWRAGRAHTTSLLPAIDRALTSVGAAPGHLTGIAVATGPGSFNGLRAGLATAKGLAYPLAVPLLGISTFDATAYPFLRPGVATVALVAAGRGRFGAAHYEGTTLMASHRLGPAAPAALATGLPARGLLCGDLDPDAVAAFRTALPGATVLADAVGGRRAGVVAALGLARLALGDADDPRSLEPLYLGEPPVRARPSPGA